MLFATPQPNRALTALLRELDDLRGRLGDSTGVPGPWLGQLRRQARAESVGSSVSIEGYRVGGALEAALASGDVGGRIPPTRTSARSPTTAAPWITSGRSPPTRTSPGPTA